MYTTISNFLNNWKYESESTVKILNALTDESLDQKVTPDGRSLGFLAWHLTQTLPEMMGKTGLKVDGPSEDSDPPKSAKEIKEAYEKASKSLTEQLKKDWKDETLNIEDDMYGMKWNRGTTLSILILHQTHHRAQMTILMRQAGLKVPGVYGPSKEEWAAMGMEPMK